MEAQSDFRELLELFNARGVEYLIVGGYALALHGAPRFTGDLDIFVRPDRENALRITSALDDFGFSSLELKVEDFLPADQVVQLGVPPVRIDLITSLSGIAWEEAWQGRVEAKYGDVPVHLIGLDAFVKNKKATGRKRDLADLEALGMDGN